jgi:hypothetical protein
MTQTLSDNSKITIRGYTQAKCSQAQINSIWGFTQGSCCTNDYCNASITNYLSFSILAFSFFLLTFI